MFFLHNDIKSTSISRKNEFHVESNFHFGPPIDILTYSADISCMIHVKRRYVISWRHCDVNTARKNGNIFFLKRNIFSSWKSIGFTFTQKCTLEPKFRHSRLHLTMSKASVLFEFIDFCLSIMLANIIQLLTIEALDVVWCRPQSTNIDQGRAQPCPMPQ